MTRFTPSGSVDASFGSGPTFGSGPGTAETSAVQADGKILVGGGWAAGVLVRYNSDGTLDTTFGSNGVVDETASQLQSRESIVFPHFRSVASPVDGKILVGYEDVPLHSQGSGFGEHPCSSG